MQSGEGGQLFSTLILTDEQHKGTYKYGAIKRCQPLVWGYMTHDDAIVETGVGGQAKYDVVRGILWQCFTETS